MMVIVKKCGYARYMLDNNALVVVRRYFFLVIFRSKLNMLLYAEDNFYTYVRQKSHVRMTGL